MKKQTSQIDQNSADFKNMVDLLAVYTEVNNRLAALESSSNTEMMDLLDEQRAEYAEAQQAATEAEIALEKIAISQPEWFTVKKSIKTPYGSVKFHASTVIEIPNEEVTLLLLDREAETNKEFDASKFKKEVVSVKVEALEDLDDAMLARLRCRRVKKENFSVSPAKLDMGKALAATEPEQQKQAA